MVAEALYARELTRPVKVAPSKAVISDCEPTARSIGTVTQSRQLPEEPTIILAQIVEEVGRSAA